MKYVDEFRDPGTARTLLREITALVGVLGATPARPVRLMEVCGGHTHSIFRYGIEGLLPKAIELVHGPGCPVCVLPMGRIDDAIAIAERSEVIFTTFGDALRVPGSRKSLMQAKAEGADIRIVYSPLDALARTIGFVEEVQRRAGIAPALQASIGVSDGESLWAVRYSSEHSSRTLFRSEDAEAIRRLHPENERVQLLRDTDRIVVSEPLAELTGTWHELEESSTLTVHPGGEVESGAFVPRA